MIYLTGDTHGYIDIQKLSSRNFIHGKNLTKDDYVIILGDFGLLWSNPPKKDELYWLDWLSKKPWTTLVVDGNHDNHILLQELEQVEMFDSTVGVIGDSIFHLRRGEVYNIYEELFFVMGGAYSIDKHMRTDGVSWWKEEQPSYAEYEHGLDNLDKCGWEVDYVLGHTGPYRIIVQYLSGLGLGTDAAKLDGVTKYFDRVVDQLKFKKFYFGHMHENCSYLDKYVMLYNEIVALGDTV